MTAETEFSRAERGRALDLIGRIYDGALNAATWPAIVRDAIGFIGGSKGVLFTPFAGPDKGGFTIPHQVPETFVRQRAALYAEHDIWTHAAVRKGLFREGNVIVDSELVPEHELLNSVFYKEFLKPQGVARLCVGIVFGQETAEAMPTICSAMRDVDEPRFGEHERERSQVLIPHLSRALGVMFRLRDAEFKSAATLAALDRLSSGIVLLGGGGDVLHANRAARRTFEEDDGLAIRGRLAREHRLWASDARAQAAFESAIEDCLRPDALRVPHFSRGVPIPRNSGSPDYVLQFAPLKAAGEFRSANGDARAIVFVNDPTAPLHVDPALLNKLYQLTPGEIRLVQEVAAGATVESAAVRLGVSENTVRTQMKRVFSKTATHRQADLVRLLVSLGSTR